MREELEGDSRVDGNVPSDAKADESSEDEDFGVGRGNAEEQPEHAGDQHGKVESPFPADDVDKDAPNEGTDGETNGEAREDISELIVSEPELLLQWTDDEPECLSP